MFMKARATFAERAYAILRVTLSFRGCGAICVAYCLSGCASSPPLFVEAAWHDNSCKVLVNNSESDVDSLRDAEINAIIGNNKRRFSVGATSNTPYACIGSVVTKFQGSGFRLVSILIDGKKIPPE